MRSDEASDPGRTARRTGNQNTYSYDPLFYSARSVMHTRTGQTPHPSPTHSTARPGPRDFEDSTTMSHDAIPASTQEDPPGSHGGRGKRKEGRKRRRGLKITLVVLLVLLLAGGGTAW